MIDFKSKAHYTYEDLVALVRFLRSENGCDWDRVQTHASIRRNFIEEVCEACEAMDCGDAEHLKEELGDVLLQVVFHAGIEQDANHFSMQDVCDGICRKLVARHPHLFGKDDAPRDWETLKREQRGNQTVGQAMQEVSRALPALWRADKILAKAEKAGVCRNDSVQCVAQLQREITELEGTVRESGEVSDALGDVLFTAVCAARALGVDPEAALDGTCKRFADNFSDAERAGVIASATTEALLANRDGTKAASKQEIKERGTKNEQD